MISFAAAAGKRHVSTSFPALAGLSLFSAGLNRQPAKSWLYIGQSAGSAPRTAGRNAPPKTAVASATINRVCLRIATILRCFVVRVPFSTPISIRIQSEQIFDLTITPSAPDRGHGSDTARIAGPRAGHYT